MPRIHASDDETCRTPLSSSMGRVHCRPRNVECLINHHSESKPPKRVLWLVAQLGWKDYVESVAEANRRLDAGVEQNTRVVNTRLQRRVGAVEGERGGT